MSISRFLLGLALGRRLPTTSGELRVKGVSAPVTIRRDKWGVPHIDAPTELDAHFALGFCHGQDRAGQLEVMWRLARGTLAEWVGAVALPADRMSRHIGFRRSAEAQVAALDAEARAVFEAFAAGINAGTTAGLPQKPHEFAIAGGVPSAWDAADILGLLKLQSFLLPSNWDVELARLRILLADGPDAVKALDPALAIGEGSKGNKESKGSGERKLDPDSLSRAIDGLTADLAALQVYLPRGGGSNNWCISGARTASGKPLLASDPHLAPTSPPPWYLAHVRTPNWEIAGAGLAGTPGFPIGHNGFAAWGVTAGLTDNSDLFVETLGPDGRSVRQPDGAFAACEVVKEVIRVNGAPDVTEEVLITPRGPLLTPILPDIKLGVSLSAMWLQPRPIEGFLKSPTARSFEEFRGAFAKWPGLPLNLLYADADGNIGWQLVGELPTRKGAAGLLPRPGDAPDSGWTGTVPFAEMPFRQNPPCGFLATANDDPTEWTAEPLSPAPSPGKIEGGEPTGEPQTIKEMPFAGSPSPLAGGVGEGFLGSDFIDPYRARRIRELLAARDSGWTLAELAAIQLDVQSLPWREMRDAVLALTPTDTDAHDGLKLLYEWDGRVHTESSAAAVFELFLAEMCVRVARAKAPESWESAVGEGALGVMLYNLFSDRRVTHLAQLLREQPKGWFASWAAEMESALTVAVRKLRREAGPGPGFWAWGHLRQLLLEHPLFGKHRWLGAAFNRGPFPWGGDGNTVSQAGARPADPAAFTHNMANLRAAFDLSDLSKSTFVLCGGQSGNPLSPHHANQLAVWLAGESFVMPWDQADVIRAAVDTMRLLPTAV